MACLEKLVNFTDNELMTSISSSSLTVDGYEVQNLLRNRRSFQQSNSFMCEYYMKCPVDIIVSFPCLVDISHIVIEPKVSSHRSKDIEIYTLFQTPLAPAKSGADNQKQNKDKLDNTLYPCKFPKDFHDGKVKDIYQSSFNFAGKYKEPIAAEQTADKVIFTNPLISPCVNIDGLEISLNPTASTRCCSHMMVRIKWASVPVLRALQVWGTVSSRNPKYVASEFGKLLRSRYIASKAKEAKEAKVKESNTRAKNAVDKSKLVRIERSTLKLAEQNDIPKEYIDPLTFSVMSVPMLLPSGNTIDKLTLDKYINEEEKHGRLPSDPFTGIVFTGSKIPVPNSSLRTRLDDYLLKNPHHRCSANGSTTGYSENKTFKTTDNLNDILIRTSSSQKRKLDIPNVLDNKKTHISVSNCGSTHGDDMKNSLDLALGKVLSTLPSLSSKCKPTKPKCCKCGDVQFGSLFKLPCLHVHCRKCIQVILSNAKTCITCCKAFERNQVIKMTVT